MDFLGPAALFCFVFLPAEAEAVEISVSTAAPPADVAAGLDERDRQDAEMLRQYRESAALCGKLREPHRGVCVSALESAARLYLGWKSGSLPKELDKASPFARKRDASAWARDIKACSGIGKGDRRLACFFLAESDLQAPFPPVYRRLVLAQWNQVCCTRTPPRLPFPGGSLPKGSRRGK